MADTKITALTALTAADPINDVIPIVDVSDTSMAASGTTKKISVNNILSSSPTASGALTVTGLVTAGSAAITGAATVGTTLGVTGDLTVATDAFKVISATKDVCIGTVTPTFNNKLTVVGGGGGDAFITSGNGTRTGYIGTDGTTVIMGGYSNHTLRIQANDLPQMQIAPLGIFDWYDGAGGTRMTLNSTGLGVGITPAVGDGSGVFKAAGTGTGAANTLVGIDTREITSGNAAGIWIGAMNNENTGVIGSRTATGNIAFQTYNGGWGERMRINNVGNVGIGVTPSATDSTYYQSFEIARVGQGLTCVKTAFTSTPNSWLSNNSYATYSAGTVWKYAVSSQLAAQYRLAGGEHQWLNAPDSGVSGAGTTAVFTQAMTLDASGSLLIGTTSATVGATAARLHLSADGTDRWAVGPQSNSQHFIIQASNIYGVYLSSLTATSWSSASDERLKDVIEPISNAVSKVGSLRAVIGKFKSDKTNTRKPFLMAQDVLAVLPEAVDVSKPDQFGLAYTDVIPLLVAAIKELTARVQTLEAR